MGRQYRRVGAPALSWASQVVQYEPQGNPGFLLRVEHIDGYPEHPIECLLLYDSDRALVGILNRYPVGFPGWEEPMAINIWVDPTRQRRGLGTALLAEAEHRWGPIDWAAQRVTPAGYGLAESYRDRTESNDEA